MSSKLPWDMLRAESLRAVCRDLGALNVVKRRDEMIEFLKDVEERGVDAIRAAGTAPEGVLQTSASSKRQVKRQGAAGASEVEPERRSKRRASAIGLPSTPATRKNSKDNKEMLMRSGARVGRRSLDGALASGSKRRKASHGGEVSGRDEEHQDTPDPPVEDGKYETMTSHGAAGEAEHIESPEEVFLEQDGADAEMEASVTNGDSEKENIEPSPGADEAAHVQQSNDENDVENDAEGEIVSETTENVEADENMAVDAPPADPFDSDITGVVMTTVQVTPDGKDVVGGDSAERGEVVTQVISENVEVALPSVIA